MIGPFENFTDLGVTERWLSEQDVSRDAMRLTTMRALVDLGIDAHVVPCAMYVAVPGTDRKLERQKLYSLVTRDEVDDGIRAHLKAITDKHGPGACWFLDEPVNVVRDGDSVVMRRCKADDGEYLLLRTLYAHDKQGDVP